VEPNRQPETLVSLMFAMRGRSLLTMTWRDVLFAHWPVPPAVVESRLPAGLAVDTYDGKAYLGVVAFRMDPIKPRYAPFGLTFGECNLRTYVTPADGADIDADTEGTLDGERSSGSGPGPGPRPGIYFFNLDASDRLSVTVARRLFGLPYYTATVDVTRRGEEVRFHSRRTHDGAPPNRFAATYRPTGEPTEAEPGSIAAFLAERYRFYTAGTDTSSDRGREGNGDGDGDGDRSRDGTRGRGGGEGRSLAVGEIDHDPWRLSSAEATIEANTLFESNGFERPGGEPLLHYSRALPVRAGRLRRW
jgi:uncharacterized protein YqjF (DUF2071 family)